MIKAVSLIFKYSGERLLRLADKGIHYDSATDNVSAWLGLDDAHIILTKPRDSGATGDLIEHRFSFKRDVVLEYVEKLNQVPEYHSKQLITNQDGTELTIRFLLKAEQVDTAAPNIKPTASPSHTEGAEVAKAGAGAGRHKGTRQKLPVLPSDVHPGK
jgi:hypothetical protein